jgi:glycerophosphoryl diester phosphodiesterase
MTRALWLLFVLLSPAYAQTRRVVAIAHRGEHLHHPENTVPAFQSAIDLGADFIEVDVRTTADGKLILSHDATVNRCTNGHGEVARMTFDELRALDAGGARMPSFSEVLDLARSNEIGVYVDVKQASAKDLVSHIEERRMADRVVIYAGLRLVKEIQELNPKLKVMPESTSVAVASNLIEQLHPRVIAFSARDFTAEIISVVKQAKVEIYVDRMGPTDTLEGWQSAIDAGADGIQTDRPGELVTYLLEHHYKRERHYKR